MRQILLAAYVGIAPLTCHAEERGGRSSPALAPVEAKLKRCTAENPGNIPERLCTDDARQAVDGGCGHLNWSVLNWNDPAIGFYCALGARPMDDWTVYRIDDRALDRLAALAPEE